ncbi:hypothetical protein [Ferrovum sp.]|uniref:plasmid mobilization protein n=1 Tax=Ferrovum sp. TaxID=2609467 RepID=UPI0026342EDD|nr:hypothetical protein [Ferrovum sp.]
MATATERIPVLVTATEKGKIAKKAKEAGISMGEFLRRAASSYCPSEEASMLVGMLDQMNKTTAQANAAIDGALAFVEASNQRITAMEQKAVIKRKAA